MKAPRRFVVASDNHGDQCDSTSVAALWRFIDDFKPEIRIHAGDCFDLRPLRKNADAEERQERIASDVEAGLAFLNRFFQAGKERVFLRGNHDERLWEAAESHKGNIAEVAELGIRDIESTLKQRKVKMLPYDARLGVYELGSLSVIHGYHTGMSACRQHANVYGNSLFGHVHSIESAPVPRMVAAEARSIGCLCRDDMRYIRTKTARFRWANGWAYGLLFDDGTYQLFQTRKNNGKFYAVQNIQQY